MKLIAGMAAVPIAAMMVVATPGMAQAPAGAQAFAACKTCHTVVKGGRNGIGPNLNGVLSRPAGSVPGFNYSAALKASKLRWDDKTLNDYLAAPMKKVPGSRMPIATPDPAKRAAIIAYLKSETTK